MSQNNKPSVGSLVNKDLRLKMEQGWSVGQIKAMSQNSIDSYCLNFRLEYAHLLAYSFKDATVNRYVEQFIKANNSI